MVEMTAIERIDIQARESDNTNVQVEAVEIIQIVAMGVGVKGDDGQGVPTGGVAGMFLKKVDGVDYNTVFAFITTSDVTGLSTALTGKSDVGHTHAISDVTGLTSALSGKEGTITAGTISQYWRGDKSFQTLDTSVVPENGNLYHTESRVRASLLTGLSITGGSISSSDSIIQAFGKLQNQINGLLGGAIYQGTWNASTNSPSITGGSGTKGHYYVVSVAGSTNIDGVTDWKVGDWIIYNGTAWQKVDNTDAVAMVNGYIGNVVLTTADIAESGNLYFTDERGQDAIGSILANSARITLTYSDGTPAITADLVTGSITDSYLSTGINANKIGDGSVSTTEFQYINSLTSNAQTQLDGKVGNSRTLTINGVTYDLSADRSWTVSGGGTPGGSDTQMQYNNGGSFGGAKQYYNDLTHRFGFQVTDPKATNHADAIYGETIDPPASITLGYTINFAVDRPASASATQIDAPSDPTGFSFSFTYIDMPYDNSWFATQNTGGSGFTAYGQSFTWNIYAYRNVGSYRVVNPNPYAIYFTDSINDSSTTFQMDIGGWTTANGYQDGFIVNRYDSYTGQTYYIDIGNNTSYSDTGFSNTDAYTASSYASTGATWNEYVAQYKIINGTIFRGAYLNYATADANVSNAYMIINNSWSGLLDNGFWFQTNAGYYYNINTAISFDDWGVNTPGNTYDPATFLASCFQGFNTSLTDSTSTSASFNYSGGSFTADDSVWTIDIYEYRTNTVDGLKYFGNASNYYLGGDDNSSNSFTIDWSTVIGDGDGRYVVISDDGVPIYEVDYSGGTASGNLNGTSSIISKPTISSYSGITRNFYAYGYVTSPSTKYSTLSRSYSFTDSNPTNGYMIQHNWATPGNAVGYKVLESGYRSGSLYWNTTTSSFIQDNAGLGDSTVTPNAIGYAGNGDTYYYSVYSNKTVSGTSIYSATPATDSITLPTDSNFYIINISYASVSGATYKIKRIINSGSPVYRTDGGTSFDDSTAQSWGASNQLTPTEAIGPTRIDDWDSATYSGSPVLIRNKTNSALGSIAFQLNQSGTYATVATYGIKTTGAAYVNNSGLIGSGGFEVQQGGTAYVSFFVGSTSSGITFNTQGTTSRDATYKGSSGAILQFWDTSLNTVFFGATSFYYDPTSAVAIRAINTTDAALVLHPMDGAGDSGYLFQVKNSSASTLAGITNLGKGFFADSTNGNANLRIGPGNASYASFNIQHSSTMRTSPQQGDIEQQSGSLWFTDGTPTRRRVQVDLGNASSTQFWYSNANGYATSSSAITTNGSSLVIIGSAFQLQAKNGIALDAGKDLQLNTTGSVLMGTSSNMVLSTSTGTKIGTGTTQKLAFWNATPVVQQGNTIAWDTLLETVGFRASGGVSNFAKTIKPRTGGTSAGSEPMQWTSASLLTTATAGTEEFLTDKRYITITTGTARKEYTLNDSALTSGKIPVATTNGRLTDSTGTGYMRVNSGTVSYVNDRLANFTADAGNSTTTETDLYSTTLTAGQLATNNDIIEANYVGVFVSSGTATRQVKVYFGGTMIFDTGALTLSLSSSWNVETKIIRVSSSVVRYTVSLQTQGASISSYVSSGEVTGLTLANTQVLKITGQAAGVGAASNDIVAKMGYVEYKPA